MGAPKCIHECGDDAAWIESEQRYAQVCLPCLVAGMERMFPGMNKGFLEKYPALAEKVKERLEELCSNG